MSLLQKLFAPLARMNDQERTEASVKELRPPSTITPLYAAPIDVVELIGRGSALLQTGRHAEARETLLEVEAQGLCNAQLYLQLAIACLQLKRVEEGDRWVGRAIEIDPRAWEPYFYRAVLERMQERHTDARSNFLRVIERESNHFMSLIGLSDCALDLDDPEAAELWSRRAMALEPSRALAWNHLGVALDRQHRYAEAIDAFAHAEEIETQEEELDTFANLAIDLRDADRIAEAIETCERNLSTRPSIDGHFYYSLSLLTCGRLREGWNYYEFRRLRPAALLRRPQVKKATWSGQDLQGKTILLRSEQGYGDSIQFLRYAPMLKALGATVIFDSESSAFAPLACNIRGIDRVVADGPMPLYDFHAYVVSLAGVFQTDLSSIPANVPYVDPDPDRVQKWSPRIPGGALRVGLVWAGNPGHVKDGFRSISLNMLSPLGNVHGVRFFSLQKAEAGEQARTAPQSFDIVDLGPDLADFADTAAVISQLDLVISVDTAAAHLAGALAKPVWMLLPKPADWRWLLDRDDTPWYPTMRLFRQTERDDWTDVIERVADALRQEAQAKQTTETGPVPSPDFATATVLPTLRDEPTEVSRFSAITESRHGILQYLPDQPVVGASTAWFGEYLQSQLDLLARLIKPGTVVLEDYAGIGVHTLALSEMVGDTGHVFATEARPVVRRILRQNLVANRISNVTVMNEKTSALDELQLERLTLLKINEDSAGIGILEGAADTLWRLRPLLFLAAADEAMLAALADHAKEFGYRRWQIRTPLFISENFNRRDMDIFEGRVALAMLAIPEEQEMNIFSEQSKELV